MGYLLIAAAVFGLCFLVDKAFTRLFRGREQHKTGLSVRPRKFYALFGLILLLVGIQAICSGAAGNILLLLGGIVVLLLGAALITYYLSYGIYYDSDSFVVSGFSKKTRVYRFEDIRSQRLYLLQGGSIAVDLQMADGTSVTVQSVMDGAFSFLDHAFYAWCCQNHRNPEECGFHDPSRSLWFPTEEDA